MENLFNIVFKASVYGTIVGIVILLVKKIFKNKINPRYNYIIWMLLLIKLLIPFGPQSSISIFNNVPIDNNNVIIENITSTKEVSKLDYNENKSYSGESTEKIDNNIVDSNKPINIIDVVVKYLPAIWIIGTISICFVFIVSYLILHKKINRNSKQSRENISNIFINCKSKMKVKSKIEVLVSDIVQTPSLVGIINPKILIPNNMINLNDKELEYVFLHELAHYKRKDIHVNYLLIALQSIHWFNPSIWYYFKKIREDMEFATDEKVLKILKDNEHKDYGMAIITVLEKVKSSKFTPGLIGMIEDKNSVKKRIKNIKDIKIFKSKKVLFGAMGASIVLILGSMLLTSAKSIQYEDVDYAQVLYKYKSKYIGDNSNIGNLYYNLSNEVIDKYYEPESMELQTTNEPYGLKLEYDFKNSNISKDDIKKELHMKSVIIFSLIDNVGVIEFDIILHNEKYKLEYIREDINNEFNIDIREKSKTLEIFRSFIEILKPSKLSRYDLNEAISKALLKSYKLNPGEEFLAEGHVILGKKENNDKVKVYLISSVGGYSFENNIFTNTSGYFGVPMTMTFKRINVGEYEYLEEEMARDGSEYINSVKKMFPIKLYTEVFNSEKYTDELKKQQEMQVTKYLESINKNLK